MEGQSLLQKLEGGPLGEKRVWEVAEEVLGILAYLHSQSPAVVHRDIKPANLIERPDGSIALVDFGAARVLPGGTTHGYTLVGTFGYMSPEQLGGTVSTASDLYAVGATLIHLRSGVSPAEMVRPGEDLQFQHHLRKTSPELREFLSRLVATQQQQRLQSAQEARDLLARLATRPGWLKPARWTAGVVATLALASFAVPLGLDEVRSRLKRSHIAHQLQSTDPALRGEALRDLACLETAGDCTRIQTLRPEAVEPLTRALGDESHHVQELAWQSLNNYCRWSLKEANERPACPGPGRSHQGRAHARGAVVESAGDLRFERRSGV